MANKQAEPLNWKTEKRRVSDLIPYDKNPRTLTKKQAADLRKSLERFNLVEIPVVDTHDRIIAGHQRLKIMAIMGRGEEEIEVRVPCRKLSDDEFKEYLIRSNKNTGSWDFDILANAFDAGDLVEWGFSEGEVFGPDDPNAEWKGMPECNQDDLSAWKSITVNFQKKEDLDNFSKLISQPLTEKTRSIWYPEAEILRMNEVYKNESWKGGEKWKK
jgi:hypothetical protein